MKPNFHNINPSFSLLPKLCKPKFVKNNARDENLDKLLI